MQDQLLFPSGIDVTFLFRKASFGARDEILPLNHGGEGQGKNRDDTRGRKENVRQDTTYESPFESPAVSPVILILKHFFFY